MYNHGFSYLVLKAKAACQPKAWTEAKHQNIRTKVLG